MHFSVIDYSSCMTALTAVEISIFWAEKWHNCEEIRPVVLFF